MKTFEFLRINQDELLHIYKNNKWSFVWSIIEPSEIQLCEKVINSDKQLVALITYSFTDEVCSIGKFEVLEDLRNKGIGKKIINQFLEIHCCDVEVIPFCEDSKRFWEKCGFVGDKYLLCYEQ